MKQLILALLLFCNTAYASTDLNSEQILNRVYNSSTNALKTSGGGMTVGNAVSGGGANRLLYEDASQNLASTTRLQFYPNSGVGNAFSQLTIGGTFTIDVDNSTGDTNFSTSNGKVFIKSSGNAIMGIRTDGSVFMDDATLINGIEYDGLGALSITATSCTFNTKFTTYNSITSAGLGVSAIYGVGRATAQTATNTSIATYTVGATDGSFEVSANVNVTTSTLHSFAIQCIYTDETNTSRTLVMPVAQLAGSFVTSGLITNGTGTGPYETPVMHIRCKAGTAITVKTVGTFTTVTYNVEGIIKQTA